MEIVVTYHRRQPILSGQLIARGNYKSAQQSLWWPESNWFAKRWQPIGRLRRSLDVGHGNLDVASVAIHEPRVDRGSVAISVPALGRCSPIRSVGWPQWSQVCAQLNQPYISHRTCDVAECRTITYIYIYRFPWESAHSGRDVTQPCCPAVGSHEVHISADIVFAVRNQFAATGDARWLATFGCAIASEVAEFWASRVTFNATSRMYDIRGEV